ncbi:MAG: AGE family epimerase/isomerase [Hyphomonadaceae bacterium]
MSSLIERARAAKAWLFDAALPLWADAGFDAAHGQFHEKLDTDLSVPAGPRRVRVQARQTFVFALAGRMGWGGPWWERVDAGLAVLEGRGRAEGGGVGHLLDEKGVLIDARRNLYCQAFGLFACAQARAAFPQRADARLADLFAYLETQRGPNGGFLEGEVKPKPRWQNPHMHLFEAGLALDEAGAAPGGALAREMAGLFENYFYDAANGALGEYFLDDWSAPAPGDDGLYCEPGHHCEWVWLLDRWRRSSGEDHGAKADRLWTHAHANGRNGALLIEETWRAGGAKTRSSRLWAQTEWLKAALVRYEAGLGGEADIAAADDALQLYFTGVLEGLWRDRCSAEGVFIDEPAPASSFYHIALAYSELIRVAGI